MKYKCKRDENGRFIIVNGKIKTRCPTCNKEFYSWKTWGGKERKYCSKECWYGSSEQRLLAKNGKKRGEKRIDKKCNYCGIVFHPPSNKSPFCSQLCYGKSKKGEIVPKEKREKISKTLTKRWDIIGRKKRTRCYHVVSSRKYKEWRTKVFERDNWACQTCGKRGCYLEAHHIKGWTKYTKLRYDVDNGVTLCRECHTLTRRK